MESFKKALGRRIEAARVAARMEQEELAAAVGVGQPQISRWEAGLSAPRYHRLPGIAEALGVAVTDLITDRTPVKVRKRPKRRPKELDEEKKERKRGP